MANRDLMDRRSLLAMAGALATGGLSAQAGRAALAAESAQLRPVEIVNPSGILSLVFEELLKEGRYLESFGVTPKTLNVSDGSKVIAALVSGNGDLCAGGGFSSLFPAIEKGAKIKIVAGADLSPVLCIYSANPDIKSAKDLEGRSVGTGAPGALLHELVVALLIKKGVDYKKVKFVNVGTGPDVFKAVVKRTVDAGPAEVDFYDQQATYGVHALTDGALWNELPEYTNQGMFASDAAIAGKRDILVRTLAAHAKLFRFVAAPGSRDAFFKARAIGLGKSNPIEAETEWKFFQVAGRLATNLVLSKQKIDYVQKLNVMLGAQKKVLPFEQVADMSLARDAIKMLA